jgi:hypothetical protein
LGLWLVSLRMVNTFVQHVVWKTNDTLLQFYRELITLNVVVNSLVTLTVSSARYIFHHSSQNTLHNDMYHTIMMKFRFDYWMLLDLVLTFLCFFGVRNGIQNFGKIPIQKIRRVSFLSVRSGAKTHEFLFGQPTKQKPWSLQKIFSLPVSLILPGLTSPSLLFSLWSVPFTISLFFLVLFSERTQWSVVSIELFVLSVTKIRSVCSLS